MQPLMNTKNLYTLRAACLDCLAAGHALPEHGHPETDLYTIPTGCFAASPEFWLAAAEGRIVAHEYVAPTAGGTRISPQWDVARGVWRATVSGPDHVATMWPGHVWDDRYGVVRVDDHRVADGCVDTRAGAS